MHQTARAATRTAFYASLRHARSLLIVGALVASALACTTSSEPAGPPESAPVGDPTAPHAHAPGTLDGKKHHTTSPTPSPTPALTVSAAAGSVDSLYPCPATSPLPAGMKRLVSVSTASGLTSAITNMLPGDYIKLADGTYSGTWSTTKGGTATNRVLICGSRAARLVGPGTSTGYILYLKPGSDHYITIQGITLTNAQAAIHIHGGRYDVVRGVEAYNLGQEGIAAKGFAARDTFDGNYIHDTGVVASDYGEGYYIGSYNGQWATYSGGQPDTSSYNVIKNSHVGPNVRAEGIDVKEATTHTQVLNNTFDGSGGVFSTTMNRSCIKSNGDSGTYSGNSIHHCTQHGVWLFQQIAGYGGTNMLSGNAFANLSGYGVYNQSGSGNVIKCSNTTSSVTQGLSNSACTP